MGASGQANAGSIQVGSGQSIWQRTYVFQSGSVTNQYFPPPSPTNQETDMLTTNNIPNLQWYVILDNSYTVPAGNVNPSFPPGVYVSQNNITFVPIISNNAAFASFFALPPVRQALPYTAPILLPVGLPIRINQRAAVNQIGFWINAPVQAPATLNRIHVFLSASQ